MKTTWEKYITITYISAKRTNPGKNNAIPLTPDQAKEVANNIIEKWDGNVGLPLHDGRLEKLIEIYGPDAKLSDVLDDLKQEPKH